MKPEEQARWKNEVLELVFEAMAASEMLTSLLIYKGARVLNRRLPESDRQSLDIDSNLSFQAEKQYSREEQAQLLEHETERAVRDFFEMEDPVRYVLMSIRVRANPRLGQTHPLGWNAFEIHLQIRDLRRANVIGLPGIRIDVAAPEELLDGSTEPLEVGEQEVVAYSLSRLAGEKLRAFLSSLPEYRQKVKRSGETVRGKDIYDIARIHRVHPLADERFWRTVGAEFHIACASRYVDCGGVQSFEQNLEITRHIYVNDPTIPRDIPFDDGWVVLRDIIKQFEAWGILPFSFPKPAAG
jgi:hypothetical protein